MKLNFRFIWMLLRTIFRRYRVDIRQGFKREFKVLITDLDVNRHMNNGRYTSLMDLVWAEMAKRAGIWDVMKRKRWAPIVVATYVRHRKDLRRGDRFTLSLEIIHAAEGRMYLEYHFLKDGEVHCRALQRAGFHKRGEGWVSVSEMGEAIGLPTEWGEPPDYLAKWIEADDLFR